jgi:hypothetical protein
LRNVFNGRCLLKGNGSETHDVRLWPNQCKDMMKYNLFHSINPSYGRERTISESISILQCKCNAQFPFRYECKKSCINEQCLDVFFKTSILYSFDFQWCFKVKTKDLERKHAIHFPRRTLMNEKRKPNNKDPNKQPNPILSMKAKTKANQRVS